MDDFGYSVEDYEKEDDNGAHSTDRPGVSSPSWQDLKLARSFLARSWKTNEVQTSTLTEDPSFHQPTPSMLSEERQSSLQFENENLNVSFGPQSVGVAPNQVTTPWNGPSKHSIPSSPSPTLNEVTRTHMALVCTQCKPRKLNCDRRIPCNACRVRGCIDSCSYSDSAIHSEESFAPTTSKPHCFPPSIPKNLPQETMDRTIKNINGRSAPPISQHNAKEGKFREIAYEKSLLYGSKDPTVLANIDDVQKWLDDNLNHPDRQARIRDLINYSLEHDDYLPRSICIDGVEITGDGAPVAGGSFADVYKGVWKGQPVAIKRFRRFMAPDGKNKIYRRFCREAITWRQLRHPRVLPFLGIVAPAFSNKGFMIMISPWMSQGTLMEYLVGSNTTVDQMTLIKDMASGLGYLHGQSLAHGDVHGSNVFVDEHHRAVLGDFGLTAVADMGDLAATTTVNKAGAIRWLAPELIHQDDDAIPPRKTTEGDIFAFGRLCLSVYTRRLPYYSIASDAGVLLRVITHRHPSRPAKEECYGVDVPVGLWDLILQCWGADPVLRPSIVNIESQLALSS